MTGLYKNVLLALVWTMLTGDMSFSNLIVGLILGFIVLLFPRGESEGNAYARRVLAGIVFGVYFFRELVVSSLRVAHDVVTPTLHAQPGIVAIPLEVETDLEITTLANAITLTPGTITMDISEDRKVLYVHAMYAEDPDEVRRQIKEGLERRVLELMR